MVFSSFLEGSFLTLHNLTRWVVLAAAGVAIWRAYRGWLGKRDWLPADDRAGKFFSYALDVQATLGLILYFFFSSASNLALADLGLILTNPVVRFFGLIHILAMFIGIGIAQVGRTRIRRAASSAVKFKRAALFFSAATLVILLAIPWEFIPSIGRPLFRLLGFTL